MNVVVRDDYEYHREMTRNKLDRMREALGRPAWEADRLLLYEGDCIELMHALPPGTIDLAITSPPYNIGKEYERLMSPAEYVAWSRRWLVECANVLTPVGALWLNLGYMAVPGRGKAVPISYLLWPELPLDLVQEVVWNYGAGVSARKMFSPRNEKWLWLVKNLANYQFDLDAVRDPNVKYPHQRKNGRLRVNPNGKNPSDVWSIPKVTTGEQRTGRRASPERTAHPAQFPLAVVERIVRACSRPSQLVMDPFAGSGTSLLAAYIQGRAAVGFELDHRYVDLAAKRLERALTAPRQQALDLV